jgi:hypothetical protein
VVGELVQIDLANNGGRVTALALYEDAFDAPPEEIPPLRIEKVFHAEGLACPWCGRRFDWYPSLPSLQRLLKRYE